MALSIVFTVCAVKGDSVTQDGDVMGLEGKMVTLPCRYDTTALAGSQYLFWYQQKPNGFPQYMLRRTTFGDDTDDNFKGRFNATLNTDMKTVPLTMQDLQVSDSAVYYCALQPTVTAAHSTLIQKHSLTTTLYSVGNQMLCTILLRSFTKQA